MKVTLNIENDEELRSHIKNAIKGQIMSIVRDEYYEFVKKEIERKVSVSGKNLEYYLKEAIERNIRNLCKTSDVINALNKEVIIPIVVDEMQMAINRKDWNKLVDELAQDKIKSLLK